MSDAAHVVVVPPRTRERTWNQLIPGAAFRACMDAGHHGSTEPGSDVDLASTDAKSPRARPEYLSPVEDKSPPARDVLLAQVSRRVHALASERDALRRTLAGQARTHERATPPPASPRRHHHMEYDS